MTETKQKPKLDNLSDRELDVRYRKLLKKRERKARRDDLDSDTNEKLAELRKEIENRQ